VGPPFVPEVLPSWLDALCAAVSHAAKKSPRANHVLVNHYQPGQGILPHTDGPAYSPWAAVLSLGSAAVFEFWRDHAHAASGEASVLAVLLPPRSLLVFSEDAYCHHLHGLADRPCDPLAQIANRHLLGVEGPSWHRQLEGEVLQRGERYSLTIRHVPETT
ncbi:Alpha-ketoglutarate-dependent dioxygenase alkB homolog 6 (Alkylated DNA repair protein alkB homolog 6), partial [Durusdinium trenchii]